MKSSLVGLVYNAYEIMLKKLHWLRGRSTSSERAGEFWTKALARMEKAVYVKAHVQSQERWFNTDASILPIEVSFPSQATNAPTYTTSRFQTSFDPDVLAFETGNLSSAVEVA